MIRTVGELKKQLEEFPDDLLIATNYANQGDMYNGRTRKIFSLSKRKVHVFKSLESWRSNRDLEHMNFDHSFTDEHSKSIKKIARDEFNEVDFLMIEGL